ncbi:MAG: GlsB/YeaQ/YmgE family stress response rane protein [Sphingomonadales bacterium]|jgi:uncharacterized membrane protein YeaQ/YmgE (transglycosylase-associated protein family)|nr:GlsB/YeaQ/YmgE family stress response rane protein [Sphingomonadales bacterium]MDB5713153.1 GlsB/YeaQ/YmgE family stress response rane protein [Sphingomonadales bacterium]
MIGLLMWLIVGGIIGWLASIVMRTDGQQGLFLNIIVGIVGAFIGGLIFGHGEMNDNVFSAPALIAAFLGAVILLAIINLIRRGRVR